MSHKSLLPNSRRELTSFVLDEVPNLNWLGPIIRFTRRFNVAIACLVQITRGVVIWAYHLVIWRLEDVSTERRIIDYLAAISAESSLKNRRRAREILAECMIHDPGASHKGAGCRLGIKDWGGCGAFTRTCDRGECGKNCGSIGGREGGVEVHQVTTSYNSWKRSYDMWRLMNDWKLGLRVFIPA